MNYWFFPILTNMFAQTLALAIQVFIRNSVQFIQSCLTVCSPMDCSTPVFPVLHHFLALAQTHVHWVGDASQPSLLLLSLLLLPSIFRSQHQGLFQWVGSLYRVAKGISLAQTFNTQSLSCVWLFAAPWTAAQQMSLFLTSSQSLPKFMSIASMIPSSHIVLWYLLLRVPSIFPSIRDFSNESAVCIDQNTGASASASVLPSIQGWFPLRLTGLIF